MDFKKILFISVFLLAILSIGAVSAAEDVDSDAIAANDINADINEDIVQEVEEIDDNSAGQEDAVLGAVEEDPVSVADAQINVTPLPEKITYKEDKNVTISLKSGGNVAKDATGKLIISEGETQFYNGAMTNGTVIFNLNILPVGQHKFSISYNGTDYSAPDFDCDMIEIHPIITVPSEITVGDNKFIEMEVDQASTGFFHVIVDGDTATKKEIQVVDGKAQFSVKDLDDGNVKVEIIYYLDGAEASRDIKELDIASVKGKVVAKDVKMYYYDGTKLAVTVYGTNGKLVEYGEEVTIKIGKKTYYAETNTKGVAYLTIKELPGKYSVKISYTDANDKVASIPKSLVVQKVLTLKTATVKKSAKKLVLSATLKKGSKPISGKKITFKFNGKTYKATTSKKGIAKVTIKKAVLKKLKVGKKVKYQATYVKCVVKKTAKVKK